MDYPFENLNPERFQLFCQSLLAQEFPDLQCFPVAQPDGGRDAVAYISGQGAKRFIVYQVKYVRRPAEADAHSWLLDVIAAELPKVRALIPKGAERYYLVTNIEGTAHPDVGSIDKANKLLSDGLGLPAICWWRNDISRRLDNSWTLKWVYPELMSGVDFLRLVANAGVAQERERRELAIRAFLRNQYSLDEEVRFKQVELQNKLLDLFIDVPATLRDSAGGRKRKRAFHQVSRSVSDGDGASEMAEQLVETDGFQRWQLTYERSVGAASLLLSVPQGSELEHVVLEGGPGQGKSTITQYICQVHRMRLLGIQAAAENIAEAHRSSAIRLPIRIDLRDFATWLSRKDPFSSSESPVLPPNWARTLEAFVAAMISHQSGGASFSPDDLLAIARVSAMLIVFDGLDEVADIGLRRTVVDELVKGCQRLEEVAAALQTIVTSRPAAFANSPGMPERQYTYLSLQTLSSDLILRYADRWVTARRLDSKLRAEFGRILKTKLDQPHLRDLARNPMQLAILLSLLLTRGASLPDKRTALYDAYMDLFFSRESEKSSVVRDHRDLLVEIHRYLAWLLHSEAEKGNARANISQERLQKVVAEYLARERYDASLAEQLFAGMVERVVALVSRVQGTFEFEVQPLREYFAACFLFHTAPLSTPGKERSGSRPDRFDAIVRNFYWLNVTRFYAGCYSKGELPSLVERLDELCRENGYSNISDPRVLAATLLGDWVFTQNPRSVQEIVQLVVDGVSLRRLSPGSYSSRRSGRDSALVLPPRAGREQLVAQCFQLLGQQPAWDFAHDVVQLIQANTPSPHDHVVAWRGHFTKANSSRTRLRWLEYGSQLGIVSTLPLVELRELLHHSAITDAEIAVLYAARRNDFLEEDESTLSRAVSAMLDGELRSQPATTKSALDLLAEALRLYRYSQALSEPQPVPLSALEERYLRPGDRVPVDPADVRVEFDSQRKCLAFWEASKAAYERTAREWASEISPWSTVVECGRSLWGDRPVFNQLATLAAAIRSTSERCATACELFDASMDLCARARYARLRSSDAKYVAGRLEEARTGAQRELALMVLLTWSRFDAIASNTEILTTAVDSLNPQSWRKLFSDIKRCRHLLLRSPAVRKARDITTQATFGPLSVRTACILTLIAPENVSGQIFRNHLADRWQEDASILEFALVHALDIGHVGSESWMPNLDVIRSCYERGQVAEPLAIRRKIRSSGAEWVPLRTAEEIAASPMNHPGFLVEIAQERLRKYVASKVLPVADIAARDQWFPHQA